MAVVLPNFIDAALSFDQPVESWLKIAAPLSVMAGWGIFEAAEYTEKARLELLAKLDRAGEDISEMINAGKFPWVRHFVDNEPLITKITRFFGKM